MLKRSILVLGLVSALALTMPGSRADEPSRPEYGPRGNGPMMMNGPGRRWDGESHGDGYGRGYGYRYGPGMMGGGFGPGMMGGYGMGGPGMMGGAGMMGGYGYHALAGLDLTDAQRKQVITIQDDTRKKNWAAMGAMQDEMAKMRDGFWSGERDRKAILAANRRMFDIRQQMLENSLDAADRIEKVLTPEQREQLKKHIGPAWMMGAEE
jgi:Spy/CpxP family protein refolding chaperone